MIPKLDEIKEFIENNNSFVIVQADNPDGDSLATALALESILADMGKTVDLYCGVEMPGYLKFISGWDRVSKDFPNNFDATIIVDTSANNLLGKLNESVAKMWVASKPVLVLDHHSEVISDIPYATIVCNAKHFVSTGELVYEISKQLGYRLSADSNDLIVQSILSDSWGLISEGTTSETYRRMADLIDAGVDRPILEEARRSLNKMPVEVFRYKAQLIERCEFYFDDKLALVTVPEDELYSVGTLYNPKPLILNELGLVEGVKLGIILKLYKNRVTGAVRSSDRAISANALAEQFNGGGHPYMAGFKIEDFPIDFNKIKNEVIAKAGELLN